MSDKQIKCPRGFVIVPTEPGESELPYKPYLILAREDDIIPSKKIESIESILGEINTPESPITRKVTYKPVRSSAYFETIPDSLGCSWKCEIFADKRVRLKISIPMKGLTVEVDAPSGSTIQTYCNRPINLPVPIELESCNIQATKCIATHTSTLVNATIGVELTCDEDDMDKLSSITACLSAPGVYHDEIINLSRSYRVDIVIEGMYKHS